MTEVQVFETRPTDVFDQFLSYSIGGLALGKIISFILLLAGCVIGVRLLTKLASKALGKTKLQPALVSFVRSCIRAILWVLAALILADALGIPSATLVAAVSVAGLALSLSLQSILSNLFSGFTLLFTKPFASGDYVDVGASGGTVTAIGLFYTTLVTPDGKEVHIPNSEVSSSRVVNYSAEPNRRIDLAFCLEYSCPAVEVRSALLAAASEYSTILADPAPEVLLSGYKSSGVEYTLRVWVQSADYWSVFFALNESARASLENNGLHMAFDRIDVHITETESAAK